MNKGQGGRDIQGCRLCIDKLGVPRSGCPSGTSNIPEFRGMRFNGELSDGMPGGHMYQAKRVIVREDGDEGGII